MISPKIWMLKSGNFDCPAEETLSDTITVTNKKYFTNGARGAIYSALIVNPSQPSCSFHVAIKEPLHERYLKPGRVAIGASTLLGNAETSCQNVSCAPERIVDHPSPSRGEAGWLEEVNRYRIGPPMLHADHQRVITTWIDGPRILNFLASQPLASVRQAVSLALLRQARLLDALGIHKGEFVRPDRHVLVPHVPPHYPTCSAESATGALLAANLRLRTPPFDDASASSPAASTLEEQECARSAARAVADVFDAAAHNSGGGGLGSPWPVLLDFERCRRAPPAPQNVAQLCQFFASPRFATAASGPPKTVILAEGPAAAAAAPDVLEPPTENRAEADVATGAEAGRRRWEVAAAGCYKVDVATLREVAREYQTGGQRAANYARLEAVFLAAWLSPARACGGGGVVASAGTSNSASAAAALETTAVGESALESNEMLVAFETPECKM